MDRPYKSLFNAYGLWLLVGIWGGHRFYLGRQGSAMMIVLLHIAGWALLILSAQIEDIRVTWVALGMLMIVGTWVVVDVIYMPSMIDQWNDGLDKHDGPYMPGAFNPDPGFGATLKKAGAASASRSGKKAIPDDYVLPWRREGGGGPSYTAGS